MLTITYEQAKNLHALKLISAISVDGQVFVYIDDENDFAAFSFKEDSKFEIELENQKDEYGEVDYCFYNFYENDFLIDKEELTKQLAQKVLNKEPIQLKERFGWIFEIDEAIRNKIAHLSYDPILLNGKEYLTTSWLRINNERIGIEGKNIIASILQKSESEDWFQYCEK